MKSKLLIPICLILAFLILIIGMTTVSFSWFEPDTKEGVGLQFNDSTLLRAENCEFETFSGTLNNTEGTPEYGLVQYEDDAISSANVTVSASGSGENVTPSYAYYKTVVTNKNADKDTVVSLYLKSFTINSGSSSLGVAVPTNSFRTFSATQSDLHIVRNAHISYRVQNEARTGELVVEWFVKCDSGSVTFNPGDLYLMYN